MPELVEPAVPAGRLSGRPQPEIEAGDLFLRPWTEDDAGAIVEAYSDPAIQRWHVRTMDDAEAHEWIGERSRSWASETGVEWAVLSGGAVVGRVGFRALDLIDGRGEAAYWVLPQARRRGVAVGAIRAASAWMFDTGGFHRLDLLHSTRNEPSCRVAVAAGYPAEGTQARSMLHADGWHDMHVHTRIAGPD